MGFSLKCECFFVIMLSLITMTRTVSMGTIRVEKCVQFRTDAHIIQAEVIKLENPEKGLKDQ